LKKLISALRPYPTMNTKTVFLKTAIFLMPA
jgi:hypothetical protein